MCGSHAGKVRAELTATFGDIKNNIESTVHKFSFAALNGLQVCIGADFLCCAVYTWCIEIYTYTYINI